MALSSALVAAIAKYQSFMFKFLCDWQGPVRQAILYADWFLSVLSFSGNK